MKKASKLLSVLILLAILVCALPVSVSANSPGPAVHLTVVFSNLPENAVYADILIKIQESDPNYVAFQPNEFADDVQDAQELVNYSVDGFRSFTYHYKDAMSNMKLEPYYDDLYYADFCNGSEFHNFLTQYEDLRKNYSDVKVVLLDKDFQILVVSGDSQSLKDGKIATFDGQLSYDAASDRLEADTRMSYSGLFFLIMGILLVVLFIFLSVGTEVVTALLFRLRGKRLVAIVIVNACTQITMRILYLALPFTYLLETIILEVLVYSAEFIVYKKRFKDVSTAKILAYTVTANTASLLLGILLDCYILV